LKFQREFAVDVWDEIQPLLVEHWREIAHFDDIPLDPRREVYFALEAAGKLRVFTLRDAERRGTPMVGYAVFVVSEDIHYGSTLTAKQDVLFLLPSYRNVGNGAHFINACDFELQGEGVKCVFHHVKLAHDFGRLLGSLGYTAIETIHVKRLDHGV
jgi:GNAT superfamily N-acetyltransferase